MVTATLGTLKDLCSEDKHRVRQLIEDLARVGSEKEIIERSLRNEREQNQELLSRMKKQQLELAEEKHHILYLMSILVAIDSRGREFVLHIQSHVTLDQ